MKKFFLVAVLIGSMSSGCATQTGRMVVACTVDAGSSLLSDVVQALSKDNYEQAIAGLIYPVGKALAEDVACVIRSFLDNPKLSADPSNVVVKQNARAYLINHHYVIK